MKLPYEQIFQEPGKAQLHNNIIMWQIDTDKFPGPALSALGTGQTTFRWWHLSHLQRDCWHESYRNTFRVLRSSSRRRRRWSGSWIDIQSCLRSKNQCGVLIPGVMNTCHSKSPSANTYLEVQNLRSLELIKSPSKDKRWAIRESSAKVSRFYLVPVVSPRFA